MMLYQELYTKGREIMLRLVVAISIAALVVPETLAYTVAEEKVAQAICAQAVKNINILADFTRTDCTFAKDGDALGLIFISVDLVFANERSKKAYLSVLVGAAGAALNENPKARITTVSFMDKHLGQRNTYFTISAKETARLQRDIKADRLTFDSYYNGILAAGKMQAVKDVNKIKGKDLKNGEKLVASTKELQAKRKQAIEGFIKDGVFMKVVQPAMLPHVHIDKGFYLLTYDGKSAVMNITYAYFLTISKENSAVIIKDGYTGKRIGSYSEYGLKLK